MLECLCSHRLWRAIVEWRVIMLEKTEKLAMIFDRLYMVFALAVCGLMVGMPACSSGTQIPPTTPLAAQTDLPPSNTPSPQPSLTQSATLAPSPSPTMQPPETETPTNSPMPATATSTLTPVATSSPTTQPTASDVPSSTPASASSSTSTPIPTPTEPPLPTPTFAPSPTPQPPNTLINQLTDGMENVTVIGNVVNSASFARGFKLTLADTTGQIVLLLWEDVYDALPNKVGFNYGARIQVKGNIGSFEGERQITPAGEWDVILLSPGGIGTGARPINQITMEQLGWRAAIAGNIQSVSENSGGVVLTVGDETGHIELFIWHNIFNRIPNNGALRTVGTSILAAGRVQEFRGELQLVPALPYDIQIQ